MGKIFISYKSEELNFAEHVANYLEGKNLEAWYAPRNIVREGGGDYDTKIINAIKNCDAFVLILSKLSDTSIQVKRELVLAADRYHKKIFPLKIDNVEPEELEYFLGALHKFEWQKRKEQALDDLITAILASKDKKISEPIPEPISIANELRLFIKNFLSNPDEAKEHLRKIISMYVPEGTREQIETMDRRYKTGNSYMIEQNYVAAVRLYEQAAEQGHIGACLKLAFIYQLGPETIQNDPEKVKLYLRKAMRLSLTRFKN